MDKWVEIVRTSVFMELLSIRYVLESNNIIYVEDNGSLLSEYTLGLHETYAKIYVKEGQYKLARKLLIENGLEQHLVK